jgi:hypothetical protein
MWRMFCFTFVSDKGKKKSRKYWKNSKNVLYLS